MLSSPLSLRRALPLTGLSAPALVLALAGSALGADTPTVQLSQPVPQGILSASQYLGRTPATTQLSMSIALVPANRAAFQAYADSVADHRSPNYRKFLTPAQIGAKFGASTSTVNTTVAYLKSKGMRITMIADNHMAILFTGTAAQAEAAFGTKLGQYRGPSVFNDGTTQDFRFFQSAPKAPSSIASKVRVVSGLETYFKPSPRTILKPSMTRVLYGASSLYDSTGLNHKGEGVNVGISNFDGIRLSNVPLFYSQFGLPAPTGGVVGSNIIKVGDDPELQNYVGEGDLDVQCVLAVAPKCTMYIYTADDILTNLARQANDNRADIITESYGFNLGLGVSYIESLHDQHAAMSTQGITFVSASGDHGTDLGGYDYPNFDPDLISVGGTSAQTDGLGNRTAEDGWVGSGSGWSTFATSFNVRPTWQKGNTVPTSPNFRLFPDLAVHAWGRNVTFEESVSGDEAYYIYLGNRLTANGGTSAAAPTFAGELALILQELQDDGGLEIDPASGRARLGALQKSHLYTVWDGRSDVFYDTTTGDAGKLPDGTESVGKVGWDYVTGYGAPSASGMLNALLEEFVPPLTTTADDAVVYSTTSPSITFGTSPQGDAANLTSTDAITYSVLSVKQNGVGQVAAATLNFTLQADPTSRRSAKLNMSLMSERLTTEFVYLYNYTTAKYDQVKTLAGTGSMGTVSLTLDESKYVQNNQVQVLVRGLKPARLGNVPFRITVDQATIAERVKVTS